MMKDRKSIWELGFRNAEFRGGGMRWLPAAMLGALLLAGCSSKEPMDYLPEMPAYLAFNADQARASDGGKRMIEAAKKIQPEAADLLAGSMKKLYVGIEPQRRSGSGFAVALGDNGFASTAQAKFRQQGATEQKMSGHKVLTSGTVSMMGVGDKGVVVFSKPEDLDKMVRTSQKKNPSARQSPTFQSADSLLGSHAFVMAVDWTQVLSMAGPMLDKVSAFSPKGTEAIKQVRTATLSADWQEQPVLEGTLHLPNADAREDLAGFVNLVLSFGTRAQPKNMDPAVLSMIKDLKAETSEQGVSIKVSVPKEAADGWLQQAEQRGRPR